MAGRKRPAEIQGVRRRAGSRGGNRSELRRRVRRLYRVKTGVRDPLTLCLPKLAKSARRRNNRRDRSLCVALRGSGVHDRVSSRPYKREKERPLALATGVPVLPRHGLRHPQRQAERRRPLLDMCDLRLVLGDYVHDLAVVTLAGPMRRDGERDEKPAAAPRGDRLPTSSIS